MPLRSPPSGPASLQRAPCPCVPRERPRYRRPGAEMQRNYIQDGDGERPGAAWKPARRCREAGGCIAAVGEAGGGRLRGGAHAWRRDPRCCGRRPRPRAGPSMLPWTRRPRAGRYRLHACAPPKSACCNLFPQRDGVRRWEASGSRRWRPHEWVRVLIQGPRELPRLPPCKDPGRGRPLCTREPRPAGPRTSGLQPAKRRGAHFRGFSATESLVFSVQQPEQTKTVACCCSGPAHPSPPHAARQRETGACATVRPGFSRPLGKTEESKSQTVRPALALRDTPGGRTTLQ